MVVRASVGKYGPGFEVLHPVFKASFMKKKIADVKSGFHKVRTIFENHKTDFRFLRTSFG